MPAVSKAQQRFMGMVHAAQKGDMENPSPEVEKAADSMSDKDAKDFASTSHKGLPDKKENMITRNRLKEIVKEVMVEEADYQTFFKKALEKAGKGINDMSDDEKKSFFNKVDAAWNGKGEKNEELTGGQHKLDVDKDGDIEGDDLADLRAGKKVDEASTISEPGAWVAYLSMTRGKKLLKTFDTARGAKQFLSKNVDKLLGGANVESVGIMTKKQWDVGEAKYAIESVNEAVDVKAGGYRLVSKPNEGVKLYYDGKVIATGFYDMDDWYFWMQHSNWKGSDKGFNNPKEIINYFRAKKITTESVNEEDTKSPEETLASLKQMAMGDLERIEDYAEMISDRMKEGQELSAWMYSQITLAVDQLNAVHDTMDGKDGIKESVNESKKAFKVNPGIGSSKYSISSHDGVKKHKDGSDFWDIEIFKNKVDLEKGIKKYTSNGFVKESVNEVKYPTDLKVGSVILGQGFTMLKGIEDGKYYKIVAMDDTSATLVPADKSGNTKGSKQVRHKLDSIEGGIKTAKRGDENGIVIIKESTPGEQIQNLNNRLTKLRQDMAKAKSPEAKNVIQAKMKNALQKLSDKKKDMGIKKP